MRRLRPCGCRPARSSTPLAARRRHLRRHRLCRPHLRRHRRRRVGPRRHLRACPRPPTRQPRHCRYARTRRCAWAGKRPRAPAWTPSCAERPAAIPTTRCAPTTTAPPASQPTITRAISSSSGMKRALERSARPRAHARATPSRSTAMTPFTLARRLAARRSLPRACHNSPSRP